MVVHSGKQPSAANIALSVDDVKLEYARLEAKIFETGHFSLPYIFLGDVFQLGRLTQAIPSKLPFVAFNCSDSELRLSSSN